MNRSLAMKRLFSILVSVAILVAIYSRINLNQIATTFRNTDLRWLLVGAAMVIPLTLLSAWRLQQLVPSGNSLPFRDATRLILAASGLNMILPSKMGDIAKAYFMQKEGHLEGSLALSLVVFEKTSDMLALLMWCLFGLVMFQDKGWLFWSLTILIAVGLGLSMLMLGSMRFARFFFGLAIPLAPNKVKDKLTRLESAWMTMLDYLRDDKRRYAKVMITSMFIWLLHLLQIWFFILALRAWTPLVANLALAPLAILVGLLPFTFAGIGTRDAAIVFFYQPYLSAPVAAALGVLFTLRYLLPAIGGLPFLGQYMVRGPRPGQKIGASEHPIS